MPGTHLGHIWDTPETHLGLAWAHLGHIWDMPRTHLRYAWDTPGAHLGTARQQVLSTYSKEKNAKDVMGVGDGLKKEVKGHRNAEHPRRRAQVTSLTVQGQGDSAGVGETTDSAASGEAEKRT